MHGKNLSHGDIDPKNIMIKDGEIKIVDFGFSSHLSTNSQLKKTGAGKFFYAAPEVISSNEEYSPHQADVFSFGCVMYFMANGKDDFKGGALHGASLYDKLNEIKIPDVYS